MFCHVGPYQRDIGVFWPFPVVSHHVGLLRGHSCHSFVLGGRGGAFRGSFGPVADCWFSAWSLWPILGCGAYTFLSDLAFFSRCPRPVLVILTYSKYFLARFGRHFSPPGHCAAQYRGTSAYCCHYLGLKTTQARVSVLGKAPM